MKMTMIMAATTLLARAAFGQSWVEERTFVSDGQATPRMDALVSGSLAKKLGATAWFQVQKNYSETWLAATYSPKSWLQLGIGPGMEQYVASDTKKIKSSARIGSFAWVGNKRNSALFIAEDGGSGFWYKIEALHTFNRFFDAGFIEERYKGSGAELRFKIPHTPLAVWVAPMFSRYPASYRLHSSTLIGVRWSL